MELVMIWGGDKLFKIQQMIIIEKNKRNDNAWCTINHWVMWCGKSKINNLELSKSESSKQPVYPKNKNKMKESSSGK